MNNNAVFTIVSNNYLHFARTLLQSVKITHPQNDIFCVIVDKDIAPAVALSGEFEAIPLNQLDLPGGDQFLFQYTILELNTAVKPWSIERLLKLGYKTVTYIDPDIYVYRPLNDVYQLLNSSADIVVTPHLLAPVDDNKIPGELDIRRAGTYNFGFCAVRESENTRAFLKWWQGKLEHECIVDFNRGIFVDQSWIDLVPGLFQNVAILRHPGYNVAYWNLAQRKIEKYPEAEWLVNNEPLIFFHFSGFNPIKPEPFSKHQNRFNLTNLGAARELAINYADRLIQNGAKKYIQQAYGYGRFSDNTPIPDEFRKLYRETEELRLKMGAQPFDQSEKMSDFAGGNIQSKELVPTYAMQSIWNAHPDLQAMFPVLSNQKCLLEFFDWFITHGNIYFLPFVIEQHKKIITCWRKQTRSEKVTNYSYVNQNLKLGVGRARALYLHLLGRLPESEALRHHSGVCRTLAGYLRSWITIGLSPESRSKPRLLMRLLKAVKLYRLSSYSQNRDSAKDSNDIQPSYNTLVYDGFYTADSDVKKAGIWVSEEVAIPFSSHTGNRVVLSGTYFPSLIKKQTNSHVNLLQFWIDSMKVYECELSLDGDFEVSFNLPEVQGQSVFLLRIVSDKVFVPKNIGLDKDDRRLAWKLKTLIVGGLRIVDCTRALVFLPPTEFLPVPGVNLIGYIAAELGVGEGARAFAKAAVAAEIPYSVIDVGYQSSNLQRDKSAFEFAKKEHFDIDVLYVNADQTPSTLEFLRHQDHRSKIKIGFWHWEQPQLPIGYLSSFEGLSEIWVPSAFVQDAVAKISPVPVFKVPHVVEFATTPAVGKASFDLPEDRFIVLVMYDFHSYQYRKNPEASIKAFRLAAANRSDAMLLIKTINADKYPDEYAALKEDVADMNNVVFLDRFLTRQEVFDLESCCDCMISLHRAEGFGLGPAEMMYLGKPVIATGWSGNMEFMTPMNSFPVNYELKLLDEPVGVYEAGQAWAEADIEHAAACLKRLLDEEGLAQQIGQCAAESIRMQLSSKEIGRQYRERLTMIAQRSETY